MKQGLRLEQGIHLRQEARLGTEQRLELKQLLLLRQELHAEAPPEARRGLEGIGIAQKLLASKRLHGVLIGGLSEAVWKTSNPDALARHKDVDVLVIDVHSPIKKFEGGIDWWLPTSARLDYHDEASTISGDINWWENGNGVALGFEVEPKDFARLPPGMYFPTPAWITQMRIGETIARQDRTRVSMADGVYDAFVKKVEQETNPRGITVDGIVPITKFLPYFLQLGLEHIPDEHVSPCRVNGKLFREILAINSSKG